MYLFLILIIKNVPHGYNKLLTVNSLKKSTILSETSWAQYQITVCPYHSSFALDCN